MDVKLHGGFITHSFSAGLKTADLRASGEKALATELCKPSYERGCQEKSSPFQLPFLRCPPVGGKRPCCVCQRWFRPDNRVGSRQHAGSRVFGEQRNRKLA